MCTCMYIFIIVQGCACGFAACPNPTFIVLGQGFISIWSNLADFMSVRKNFLFTLKVTIYFYVCLIYACFQLDNLIAKRLKARVVSVIKREKTIKVKVPETKYRRWRVVETENSEKENRVIQIDFRCIRNVPFKPIDYGSRARIKWNSPAHLQGLVDEYFASCFGVIYNPKTGTPYLDEYGLPRRGQIKPFTVSGLACYIHIEASSIMKYSRKQIDELGYPTDDEYIGPQYSDIIIEARKKIEAFAEERLYDRDGFNGGRFVLNCAFGWQERREVAEIKNMEKMRKLKQKEFKLKQSVLEGDGSDEPVTINIVRAQKKVGESDGSN